MGSIWTSRPLWRIVPCVCSLIVYTIDKTVSHQMPLTLMRLKSSLCPVHFDEVDNVLNAGELML